MLGHAILGCSLRVKTSAFLTERTAFMAKRKGKNLSAPAKDPKYEGRNNTKKVGKKKG